LLSARVVLAVLSSATVVAVGNVVVAEVIVAAATAVGERATVLTEIIAL
jgi:hypothetical protein